MNLEKLSKVELVCALQRIRNMAMDHALFMPEAFEKRDFQAMEDEGGEGCDWTMVAVWADDALNGK